MFLQLFSTALILANILCFKNKKYLFLFIPCILFLPNYYGIELHESFPLITVTRIMYAIFFIYTLFFFRKQISIQKFVALVKTKEFIFLSGYFIFRIIANLYYITTYSDAIKTVLSLLFEHALLLVTLYFLSPSNDEIVKLLKSIVYFAAVLFVIGIFESITFIRPFDALYTVSRPMINEYYLRLGLLRSTTTMCLPNLYGNMCILVTPFIFYLSRITRQKKYICFIVLDIFAIIHSGCRSSIIAFFIITSLYFILLARNKNDIQKALKKAFCILFIVIAIMAVLSVTSNRFQYYYSGTAKSVLNYFGSHFDLDKGAPEGVPGYGGNKDGLLSRSSQLSGILYTLTVNPLFGLGTGCQNRKQIMYYFFGKWRHFNTIDLGIVEVICSEGLLGLIGYSFLFALLAISIISKCKCINDSIIDYKNALLITLSYLLCMLSSINMPYFMLIIVYLVLHKGNIKRV